MNKFLTIATLISTIFVPQVNANEKPSVSEYAFEKTILLKDYDQEIKIPLDKDILRHVKDDFSNFALYNGINENVPFDVYIEEFKEIKETDVLDVSSLLEIEGRDSKKSDIADDNHFTVYNFSERIDRKNPSWAMFDLKRSLPLGRVEVFLDTGAKVSGIEIKAGNDVDDMKTIIARRSVVPGYNKINLSTPNYRYVMVSFWGVNIKIQDIEFTTATNGYIYFTPKNGEKYTALYGNDNLAFFEFRKRLTEKKDVENIAYFSQEKWNRKANKDLDGDGIDNEEDNCPFLSNKSQSDSDDDRIGNDCDNARNAKNYDQTDIDGDGVGDIIDNCELVKNPDQKNKDNDQYGDVCDGAEEVEGELNTQNILDGSFFEKNKVLVGIVIFLLALAALLFVRSRKKN